MNTENKTLLSKAKTYKNVKKILSNWCIIKIEIKLINLICELIFWDLTCSGLMGHIIAAGLGLF